MIQKEDVLETTAVSVFVLTVFLLTDSFIAWDAHRTSSVLCVPWMMNGTEAASSFLCQQAKPVWSARH